MYFYPHDFSECEHHCKCTPTHPEQPAAFSSTARSPSGSIPQPQSFQRSAPSLHNGHACNHRGVAMWCGWCGWCGRGEGGGGTVHNWNTAFSTVAVQLTMVACVACVCVCVCMYVCVCACVCVRVCVHARVCFHAFACLIVRVFNCQPSSSCPHSKYSILIKGVASEGSECKSSYLPSGSHTA